MKELTKSEEIILVAIWRLKEDAYGVTIRQQILTSTKKDYSYGTLYGILEQLAQKSYVSRVKGAPTPERGGRSKTFYKLTSEGLAALKQAMEVNRSVWQGITDLSFNTSG